MNMDLIEGRYQPKPRDAELARELIDDLVARGHNPRIGDDGRIYLGTARMGMGELAWALIHAESIWAALVGLGRYPPEAFGHNFEVVRDS